MRFVPKLKTLGAFGAGAATAAYFLSGPVEIPGVTPERQPSVTETLPQAWVLVPPTSQLAPLDFGPIDQNVTRETSGAAPGEPAGHQQSTAGPQLQCNRNACSNAYQSFDPDTCTYQPYGGQRRFCEK